MKKIFLLFTQKTFVLSFLFFFTLFEIFLYSYMMDFAVAGSTLLAKILVFSLFILEYLLISFLVYALFRFKFLVYMLLFLYIVIHISQLITYQISLAFLSMLALENVEFISFLFTSENVWIIVRTLLLLLVVSYSLAKVLDAKHFISSRVWLIILLCLGFASLALTYAPKSMIEQRDALLKHNYFEHTSPLEALIHIFIEKKLKLHFTKEEVTRLHALGYHFNPLSPYVLMKDDVYKGKFKSSVEKPNVIIIFTEGFSARTTSVYTNKYESLTPHLKHFSQDPSTLKVDNFYNHTAATYRGLYGQLCSLYPTLGGGSFWFDNETLNLHKNNYKCLPHILQHNGYETVYLNMHYKDESANDEMVSHFGFDKIYSGEYLSKRYLGGVNKIKHAYMTDQQAYGTLTKYLRQREESNNQNPFFLATYTVETHAFLDIGKDGVPYKNGKNNVLNTIHNMDDAFGKFWNYFKTSRFAKNTIIIFTSDHAHYEDKEYIHVMKKYKEKQYYGIFIDRVPLLIYAPNIDLPKTFNAKYSTSIDIAPTVLHLVHAKQEKNAFIGQSIFEKNRQNFGISEFGSHFYMIKENNLIYTPKNVLPEDKDDFTLIHRFITYTHELEKQNRIYKP